MTMVKLQQKFYVNGQWEARYTMTSIGWLEILRIKKYKCDTVLFNDGAVLMCAVIFFVDLLFSQCR